MAKKNIIIKKRNGNDWDECYPVTSSTLVKFTDGSDAEVKVVALERRLNEMQNSIWIRQV